MAGGRHQNRTKFFEYSYFAFYFYPYNGEVRAICDTHEQVPA